MKLISTITLFAASACAKDAIRPWVPAEPVDSRSPCPMLNTLANHGYLPHDGRKINLDLLAQAVSEALNVDPKFGTKPATAFLKGAGKSISDNFDLSDLNQPGILQHIASLTRDDVDPQDWSNTDVVHSRVDNLVDDSTEDHVSTKSIAKTRHRVESLSLPGIMTAKETLLAYIESGLVILMMNEKPVPKWWTFPGSSSWEVPKDRVRTWLKEERLPTELGWKPFKEEAKIIDLLMVVRSILTEYYVQSFKSWWSGNPVRDEL